MIAAKGLFCSLYTDRGSHYFQTPEAGGQVDRRHPTQGGSMNRDQVIAILRIHEAELRCRSVRHEALFGPAARCESGPRSAGDILIELDA